MSSHKGPAVAQGNGAPASNRVADTVELAELGPLLEEKGKRAVTSPTKVSHLPGQPLLRPVGLPRATAPWTVCPDEGRKQSGQAPYTMENPCRSGQLEGSWEEQVLPQAAVEAAPGRFISFFRVPKGRRGEIRPCPWRGLAGPLVQPSGLFVVPEQNPSSIPTLRETRDSVPRRTEDEFGGGWGVFLYHKI